MRKGHTRYSNFCLKTEKQRAATRARSGGPEGAGREAAGGVCASEGAEGRAGGSTPSTRRMGTGWVEGVRTSRRYDTTCIHWGAIEYDDTGR